MVKIFVAQDGWGYIDRKAASQLSGLAQPFSNGRQVGRGAAIRLGHDGQHLQGVEALLQVVVQDAGEALPLGLFG